MKKSVSIIGGGTAALILASFLDHKKFDISIYEQNNTLGNKFLVAGNGGFNLTHSESINQIIQRYTPSNFLDKALLSFDNTDFRNWLHSIGIPTFVGSSNRVYPEKDIKPIDVLNKIVAILHSQNVSIYSNYQWNGWNNSNELIFKSGAIVKSDYTIFALGGSSWKITGSNGNWLHIFKQKGVSIVPFKASNCAYGVKWHNDFIQKFEGTPLKNIAITCSNKRQLGEVVITKFGIEGNAIYALSPEIRNELHTSKKAEICIDCKPTVSLDEILSKIENSHCKNTTETLRNIIKLTQAQIALVKMNLSKDEFLNSNSVAYAIKNVRLEITDSAKIDEAISTVGGIALTEIDENFQLKNLRNTYCIGEMLDWDAPTGGYLIQACASMGVKLGRYINSL